MGCKLWLFTAAVLLQLARRIPKRWAHLLDNLVQDMVAKSVRFKRMPRKECEYGKPFLAYAQCEDMDCKHCWTVVSLGDVWPDSDLICPVCDKDSGGLL